MLNRMLFISSSIQAVNTTFSSFFSSLKIFCQLLYSDHEKKKNLLLFRFGENVKILHFIGQMKPWVINFDPVAKKPNLPQEYKHLTEYLDLWWGIFCNDVHPKLVTDMVSHCFRFYSNTFFLITYHGIYFLNFC